MTITAKVGLEAEFLLRDGDGNLVFPADYGFSTDDYPILGEVRAMPGESVAETVANFIKRWTEIRIKADRLGIHLDTSGYAKMDPDLAADALRRMGTKEISAAQNIHGEDILQMTDEVHKHGRLQYRWVSAGLHVHFSASKTATTTVPALDIYNYIPVRVPIAMGEGGIAAHLDLYRRELKDVKPRSSKASATVSIITHPVVHWIVVEMDKLLPAYVSGDLAKLKFRQPGFWEPKGHGGVEYRSLPFTDQVHDDLYVVVSKAHSLLRNL